MSAMFDCIVAATESGGIGLDGTMPWRFPKDMAFFKKVTSECAEEGKQNAVVMGRKTWESIPPKFRPLPGRTNVVLSRNANLREEAGLPDDVVLAASLEESLALLAKQQGVGGTVADVFVIGGGTIYAEALRSAQCRKLFMTLIHKDFPCDTFLPDLAALGYAKSTALEAHVQKGACLEMAVFERSGGAADGTAAAGGGAAASAPIAVAAVAATPPRAVAAPAAARHPEYQYLDLIRDILATGERRGDRTGTGTISKFGATMRFDISGDEFPLLTTKRVFWRGVAEELLWFISGDTNANTLKDKGIHIWDGNGSREYLDRIGLTERAEMDLGPVYGFQWRHFGADYVDMHADYAGQGVDQLAKLIDTIKTNPTDRRIILSAWNPAAMPLMALPPCHMFCQFYVSADGALSCQMYQRSADMGLGVPFNIASYALLTRLVAQACGLRAGEFVHVIGDAHVYSNHVDALKEQLQREPRPFPKLKINPAKTDIDSFVYADFTVEDYKPHKKIEMKMAV